MSQAFVREPEGDLPEDLPEPPVSPHPNYVTARGLRLLQARLAANAAAQAALADDALDGRRQRSLLAREARWLQARIASAQLVTVVEGLPVRVGFGCVVELADVDSADRATLRFQIVGEDEAEPAQGRISWRSPLALALMGRALGDEVLWPRPAGDKLLVILAIRAAVD